MATSVPGEVRERIRADLWNRAEALGWVALPLSERARWYEKWAKDKDVGGVLSEFMDTRQTRVYIKDTVLKPYLLARSVDLWPAVAGMLGISPGKLITKKYIKPHGVLTGAGEVIAWGNVRDWKAVLVAVFERAALSGEATPRGAVLFRTDKALDEATRQIAETLANRLGIESLYWAT